MNDTGPQTPFEQAMKYHKENSAWYIITFKDANNLKGVKYNVISFGPEWIQLSQDSNPEMVMWQKWDDIQPFAIVQE